MSMQVNNQPQITQSELIQQMAAEVMKLAGKGSAVPSPSGVPGVPVSLDFDELPTLAAPAGPLSLDTLLDAIGYETRKQACRDGVASLELKGEQQAEINQKELDELKEQLEKLAKKGVADGFLKVFSAIGIVLGAITSVASIAIGAATANPLLVAAGVAGLIMTVDSGLSMATDGKICISNGISELCQLCGLDEQTSKWVGLGVTMALNLAVVVMNIGGAVKAVSATAEAASTVLKVISKTSLIGNIVNGANSIGMGAASIASGAYAYQAAQSQASVKELEAILERIRMSIEMEQDMIKNEMERANALLEAVDAIIDACNKTQSTVLTMSPAMA